MAEQQTYNQCIELLNNIPKEDNYAGGNILRWDNTYYMVEFARFWRDPKRDYLWEGMKDGIQKMLKTLESSSWTEFKEDDFYNMFINNPLVKNLTKKTSHDQSCNGGYLEYSYDIKFTYNDEYQVRIDMHQFVETQRYNPSELEIGMHVERIIKKEEESD